MPRRDAVAGVVAGEDHGHGRGGRLVIAAGETRGVQDRATLNHAGRPLRRRPCPAAVPPAGRVCVLALLVLVTGEIEQQVRHRFEHPVVVQVDRQLDDRAGFGSRARSRAAIRCRSRSSPSLRAVAWISAAVSAGVGRLPRDGGRGRRPRRAVAMLGLVRGARDRHALTLEGKGITSQARGTKLVPTYCSAAAAS